MIFLQWRPRTWSSKKLLEISVKARRMLALRPLGGSLVTWKQQQRHTGPKGYYRENHRRSRLQKTGGAYLLFRQSINRVQSIYLHGAHSSLMTPFIQWKIKLHYIAECRFGWKVGDHLLDWWITISVALMQFPRNVPDVGLLETVRMRYYLSEMTHYRKISRFFICDGVHH